MRLLILDIDGVLSSGEARSLDLSLLSRLAGLNQSARAGDAVPAVTLNTGRPSAYVEAIMQAIDGWYPALFESGAGLYFPETYQFQLSPLLTADLQLALSKIISALDSQLVKPGLAYWQPGKTVCYSLFAHDPSRRDELLAAAQTIVIEESDQFAVTPAVQAINIHPKQINKGTGLLWLAETTGISLADMGGIGDSEADVDFLRLLGSPGAPANATDDVKQTAKYVSPHIAAQGAHDILDHWHVP